MPSSTRRQPNFLDLLRDPSTRKVLGALSEGEDPRTLAADLVTNLVEGEIRKVLKAPTKRPTGGRKHSVRDTKREPVEPDDVIDAEYTVVNPK